MSATSEALLRELVEATHANTAALRELLAGFRAEAEEETAWGNEMLTLVKRLIRVTEARNQ